MSDSNVLVFIPFDLIWFLNRATLVTMLCCLIWLRNSLKYDSHTQKKAHKSNVFVKLITPVQWIIASQYNISHPLVSDSHVSSFSSKDQIISVICSWIILLIPIVWFTCYNFWFTCSVLTFDLMKFQNPAYTGNAVYLDIKKNSLKQVICSWIIVLRSRSIIATQ